MQLQHPIHLPLFFVLDINSLITFDILGILYALQTMGSRTATLCSFLCCAYWFSLGTCNHSFIWACLQWWKRPVCELIISHVLNSQFVSLFRTFIYSLYCRYTWQICPQERVSYSAQMNTLFYSCLCKMTQYGLQQRILLFMDGQLKGARPKRSSKRVAHS